MKIVTHDSSFHTDDTFAVAVLLLLHPDAEVVRSRDPEVHAMSDYVVDTGMKYDPEHKLFDHHQPEGAGVRKNGIPYAAFGLVWKEFGEQLVGGKREAEIIDEKLVQPIDSHDNGVAIAEYKFDGIREYTVADFLYSYRTPGEADAEKLYKVFMNNVGLAKGLLEREIAGAKHIAEGEKFLMKRYKESLDKRLIELPHEDLPWRKVLSALPEPLYIIYERRDGNWGIKAVPDASKSFGYVRKPLPLEWAGKEKVELQNITGVADAKFAHRARFIAAVGSKEGAIKLAKIALAS